MVTTKHKQITQEHTRAFDGRLDSVEWNGGLEWWNGMVEWNDGME